MKKFSNFMMNSAIYVIMYLFVLFLILILCTYIFSIKNNMSFENTVSYFQAVVNEIIDSETSNNNSIAVNSDNTNIDNSTISINNNEKFYYKQLDDTGKIIYTTLENNIDNLKKDNFVIDFSTKFNDLLNETSGHQKLNRSFQSALDAFSYDHPELFYLDLSKVSLNIRSIAIGSITTYTVEISPRDTINYLHSSFKSEQEVNNAIDEVEYIKNSIVNTVSDENDIYNKIKKVHDLLVNSIEYDLTLNKSDIHNIYGALVQKEVVCEGYAKAFKYILDSLNIECILVSGTATNSSNKTESHMWNYVKIDNAWYGVDVTWDDPVIVNGNDTNNLRHNYLLKGYSTFIDSHNQNGKISDTGMLFSLPALSYTNYKWY